MAMAQWVKAKREENIPVLSGCHVVKKDCLWQRSLDVNGKITSDEDVTRLCSDFWRLAECDFVRMCNESKFFKLENGTILHSELLQVLYLGKKFLVFLLKSFYKPSADAKMRVLIA